MNPSAGNTTCAFASEKDLDVLVGMFDRYREFYEQPGNPSLARGFLAERLRLGDSVIIIGEIDGRAAGFTQLYPSFSSVSARKLWILNDLYVEPAHRRKGVAQALLEEARQHALKTGAKGLTLSTRTHNVTAQKLYTQKGYVRDDNYYTYNLTF